MHFLKEDDEISQTESQRRKTGSTDLGKDTNVHTDTQTHAHTHTHTH